MWHAEQELDKNQEMAGVERDGFDKRIDILEYPIEGRETLFIQDEEIDFDARVSEELEGQENVCDWFSLDEIVDLFEQEIFQQLSVEERYYIVDMLKDKLCEELRLENQPEMIVGELEDESIRGYYAPELNAIIVNASLFRDGMQLCKTIAHEIRHAWQEQRANLPEEMQTALDKALKENIENYICPEDNYREYRLQLVEMDARSFAEEVISERWL